MEILDVESLFFALLMAYVGVCVLAVYAVVGAFLLVHKASYALVRVFRSRQHK